MFIVPLAVKLRLPLIVNVYPFKSIFPPVISKLLYITISLERVIS